MPPIDGNLLEPAALAGVLLAFLAFVLAIVAVRASRRTRLQIERDLGRTELGRLERALEEMAVEVERLRTEVSSLQRQVEQLRRRQRRSFQSYALKRYPAMGQDGAPPSQSLALLTEEGDGITLTWIQTERGCYTYAKRIEGGAAADRARLSEEEAEALRQALDGLSSSMREAAAGRDS
ncbi:MAG: DUF4446 family protein [Bacillota bacterium]|nr:DUF4446 family protein [Bacillota bacterium]